MTIGICAGSIFNFDLDALSGICIGLGAGIGGGTVVFGGTTLRGIGLNGEGIGVGVFVVSGDVTRVNLTVFVQGDGALTVALGGLLVLTGVAGLVWTVE